MKRGFFGFKVADQSHDCRFRLLIINAPLQTSVARDLVVDFVAIGAHGFTARSGGSIKHSQSPINAKGRGGDDP